MCGISALIGADVISPELLGAFSETVRHRGPDGEGMAFFCGPDLVPAARGSKDTPPAAYESALPYGPGRGPLPSNPTVALAHRRLSILDLSPAGHQPMCCTEGKSWITYNGEIYNYLELREELCALGHRFATGTDTEVILAAYAEWGTACLERFQGMFAFVVVDRSKRRLFAARDRFGIKPAYYHVSNSGVLAFASEIKQFTVLPGWSARLNRQRAYDFLAWNTHDHTAETLFAGVFQLRGGELLDLPLDEALALSRRPGSRLPVQRWYSPAHDDHPTEPAEQAFRAHLENSVALHLRSDVPVGSCLSGGLDSSAIVCLANRSLRAGGALSQQRTFSATCDVPALDERRYMQSVVDLTGVDAHYVEPTSSGLFAEFDRLAWHQDEPFGSTSIYAQWNVFRAASDSGVRVMLDGQGADELLAGYHTYFGALFAKILRQGRIPTLLGECTAAQRMHGRNWLWSLQQCANFTLPEVLRQPLRRRAGRTSANPRWLDVARLGVNPVDPHLASGASKARSVRELSRAQLTSTSVPALLHYEDRDSMAHSIEARVPFLHHPLAEFCLGLRDEDKISGGITKRVLRQSMRGILPDLVRDRTDKLGFVTPEAHWMRSEPGPFLDAMADAISLSGGIINSDAAALVQNFVEGSGQFDHAAWRAISFGRWLRVFSVNV
ncbi:MAG: asparagine synthase (glutamine-hydrolyzing) [Betaproteobacteria bacterium]